ncbi:MAG: hypothetical protein QF438_09025 [Phycisphaerales bacterium]|nr:hypothetical protein [Phycisphaerales bacterium]
MSDTGLGARAKRGSHAGLPRATPAGCRPAADTIDHEEAAVEPKAPTAADEWAIQDSNL